MDARYGVGLVRVSNHGVSGTTAADFPKSLVEPGAITVVNYGINDARVTSASVDVYKARLRAINATVYQTPNPPIDDYAQPMRDVAAELGRPMIEVSANVRALPGGTSATTDGVHPNEILYAWITHQLVAPELASLVDTKLCFASRQGVTVTSNTAAIIWAAKDGAPRSGRVVFTNSDSSAVALSFGGLGAPYSIAPANCIAAPHGGSCVVEVTLDTSGTPGGQGTQVLRATLANGSTVVVPVWGFLNNF